MDFVKQKRSRFIIVLILLIVFLCGIFILNIGMGSVKISPKEIITEIHGIITKSEPIDVVKRSIIWKIRLPRAIGAIIGGAALATAGLLLQIFFRNPLVGPFVLGISSGATLATALIVLGGITFGVGTINTSMLFIAAFIGSVLVMILVLAISRKVKNIVTLLVIGLMVGYVTGSLTSVLITFAEKTQVKGFVLWTMGSFAGFTWSQAKTLALIGIPGLIITLFISKPLNALLLGENYATSMGVKIVKMRWVIVLTASLLAAVVTAFAGPISFIGLSVPHIARLSFGTTDNRVLIPGTILLGGAVTGMCDLIARTFFAPMEIPLSAVTSFIGAPIVIFLLLKRRQTL
jgi:iron complex transport system permease protein